MSLCFFFYKRKDSPLILTQHKIPSQIHIIDIVRYSVTLHSLCLLAALASCCHLQNKRHLDCPLHFTHPISKTNYTKRSSTTHDLLCQLFIFCFFFFIATNKNNQNTIDKTFSITHDTLIQLVASLIQNNPTFWTIQNKTILTTLSFHDVFAKS